MLNRVTEDIKVAMKNGDKFTLSVLRMLKSAIDLSKINQRDIPSDEETISIIRKQIKIRKDSKEEFTKYNRMEMVESLEKEIEVLSKYLPQELSGEEVDKILNDVFTELNPTSIKDMGNVMKVMTDRVQGRYEMGKISSLVKERFNNQD